MLKKFTNKKGFTLMEMLIVVAIIAVLVAIAIPTFAGQLEKSRQATDLANVRAAYAEAVVNQLNDKTPEATTPKMQSDNWDKIESTQIGGTDVSKITKSKGNTVTIKVDADGKITAPLNP